MNSRGNKSDIEISKVVSYALRHDPTSYGLALDEQGWVTVSDLLRALGHKHREWANLTEADLARMIANSKKKRHELLSGKIRALYGHSTPERLEKEQAEPPELLYHGTAPDTAELILAEGLKPMARQYVHLSLDVATAIEVGRRKHPKPVILLVNAAEAFKKGVAFYTIRSGWQTTFPQPLFQGLQASK